MTCSSKSPALFSFAKIALTSALIATVLGFAVSCSDSQPLASYQKGSDAKQVINRGQLRIFISASGSQEADQPTVAMQDEALQHIALIRTAALEARSNGLDKSAEYSHNQIMLDRRAFLAAFDLYLKTHSSSHKYKMLDAQMLFLRADPKSDRKEEAELLLKSLNEAKNDEAVEAIIFASNENERYRIQGGYLDPFCLSCRPNPLTDLTDPIKDKDDKKFVLVVNDQGYWLLRSLKVREVTASKLDSIFLDFHRRSQAAIRKFYKRDGGDTGKDEKKPGMMSDQEVKTYITEQVQAQIRRETGNLLTATIDNLKEKYPVSFTDGDRPPKMWQSAPDAGYLLFKIGDTSYTYQDLLDQPGVKDLALAEQYLLAMQVMLPSEVLKKSPEAAKVEKSKEFEFVKTLTEDNMLANLYLSGQIAKIQVSDADIEEQYNLRRFNEYKGRSLAQVKNEITESLMQEKQQSAFQQLKENLFSTYHVEINRDKLKEGKL